MQKKNIMTNTNTVQITNSSGKSIEVLLVDDGEHAHSCLTINGMHYHFERVTKSVIMTDYKVDSDPDYEPQTDPAGFCYILAPYSE